MWPVLPELRQATEVVSRCIGEDDFAYAVVLGSGLGDVAGVCATQGRLDYAEIPGFDIASVPGHAGKLLWGRVAEHRVLFFLGRFHLYQGLTASEVVAPVILAHRLGCHRILLTNASGGICPDFKPGEPVFISDHLNLTGDNPLRGIQPPPFLDLSDLYRRQRYPAMRSALSRAGFVLHQGVMAALPGPCYETPAEIRMLRNLGADLVSMSTLHEALAAHYFGMDVTAVSVVANPAAGLSVDSLNHQDVLRASRRGVSAVQACLSYLLENRQENL